MELITFSRVSILLKKGIWAEIEYFNKNLQLDPNYLPTHLNLGGIYLKLKKTEKEL